MRVSIILIVFKFVCYINLRIASFDVSAKDQYLSGMINSITFFAMIFINSLFSTIFFLETNNLVINDRGVINVINVKGCKELGLLPDF